MATVQTLDKIRESLERHLGKKILLKANKGRKQIVTKKGNFRKSLSECVCCKVR